MKDCKHPRLRRTNIGENIYRCDSCDELLTVTVEPVRPIAHFGAVPLFADSSLPCDVVQLRRR
jgi:hypothetical protein